jgi:hypothetical protein
MAKINKEKVLEEKGEVVKYTLFSETRSQKLDWLLDVYKQDRYKARVLFHNSGESYFIWRYVSFERADGSFQICNFTRKFGISKTNVIYSREKKTSSLIYKNKKFYFTQGTVIKHATYSDISNHFKYAMPFLIEKFAWLRNIAEDEYCHNTSLSTIITYKLFNSDKVLKHIYKTSTPVIKVLTKDYSDSANSGCYSYMHKKKWDRIRPYLINIENLKIDFIRNKYFDDAIEMAIKLDKRINCSWSLKRLKAEHDVWSKELRTIMLEFEPLIDLKPSKIYKDFEEFTGYKLLTTNHELIAEGQKNNHCVAGYVDSVRRGNCGIFQVSGYTLEIRYGTDYYIGVRGIGVRGDKKKKIIFSQLRGYQNAEAPIKLNETVKDYIKAFNDKYNFVEYEKNLKEESYSSIFDDDDFLVF